MGDLTPVRDANVGAAPEHAHCHVRRSRNLTHAHAERSPLLDGAVYLWYISVDNISIRQYLSIPLGLTVSVHWPYIVAYLHMCRALRMAKTFDNISEASSTNYLFLKAQRTLALQSG